MMAERIPPDLLAKFCKKCGDCCRDFKFVVRAKEGWENFWFRFGGSMENEGVKIDLDREGHRIIFIIKSPCQFQSEDGVCLIYANRPASCKGFWCEDVKERARLSNVSRQNPD